MKRKLFLGLDVGTQSVKATVADNRGITVASASKAHYMENNNLGWAEEMPGEWWSGIVHCIKEVLKTVDASNICAIGCAAAMHSPIPLGRDGALLSEKIQMFCDKRTAGIVDRMNADYGQTGLAGITANYPATNWTGLKIAWIKENQPELYENTYRFVAPKDYINRMLTGVIGTDPSEASGSMLMDCEAADWSGKALANFGIGREKLGAIARSCEVIGCVTKRASDETGLKEGTRVVAGAGDMPCALYAAGLIKKGRCVDLTGTGNVLAFYNERPIIDARIANLRCASSGWSPYYSMDSSGGGFRWLRDALCKQEEAMAREKGLPVFSYLTELAEATPPGAEGVMFFPYLLGERTMGSAYTKGAFTGLTPASGIGHFVRAVLEGVAYDGKRALNKFEEYESIDAIIHTGGASTSDAWSQIKADVYGKTVVATKQRETTALGAAMLAMVGAGEYRDEAQAAEEIVSYGKEFTPNWENHRRYEDLFGVFCEFHDAIQQPYVKLAKAVEKKAGER